MATHMNETFLFFFFKIKKKNELRIISLEKQYRWALKLKVQCPNIAPSLMGSIGQVTYFLRVF